jgi:hypothetical protein
MVRTLVILLTLLPTTVFAFPSGAEVGAWQRELADRPVGEKIAFWAEQFVGTPYDPDVLGEYVRREVIVADDRVDCMYLVFRAVELALGRDTAGSVRIALDKRFAGQGRTEHGKVSNYEDRFQYGEDMIDSGKWGREITAEIGPAVPEPDPRRGIRTPVLRKSDISGAAALLQSGDIIFFINTPERVPRFGMVGHLGIIKKEGTKIYLIHASGQKNKGGIVKKVRLPDYASTMPFMGIRVSRFGKH